ncbi:hypothetical protein [Aromatoleum sp.]|uniref:hypothetical protein n=1 Tax=Aromatoleum sp. TaxID=2307007 RepID=UPI002FC85F86
MATEAPLPAVTPAPSSRAQAIVRELLSLGRPTERTGRRFLGALLVVDLAFIAVFVTYAFAEHYGMRDSLFHGNVKFSFVDGSYPEIYGYAKEIFLTVLFVAAYSMGRQIVYLALALLFAICALDDSLALHEATGRYLAATIGVSQSAGGLIGWSLLGSVPMLAILAAYRRSDPTSRRHAEAILLAFAILLFFAVGMDLVHAVVQRYVSGFQTVLTILEDGGELLTLTLLCTMSLAIVRFSAHPAVVSPPGP